MSKRKWRKSNVPIKSIGALMDCLDCYGGVWFWKFANKEWVLSQQLRVLARLMDKGMLYYPERIKEGGAE